MESILGRIRRGERFEHYETVRVAKNGTRIDASLSVSPVKDSFGRIVGAASSERRRVAEQSSLNGERPC